jgi:hypothetical protein
MLNIMTAAASLQNWLLVNMASCVQQQRKTYLQSTTSKRGHSI